MSARSFRADDGVHWTAWDVHPGQHEDWSDAARRHLPPRLVEGWLCFESVYEKRRLCPIPSGWEYWTEERLRGACGRAEAVERRLQPPDPLP